MQNLNVYGSTGIAASGDLTVAGDINVAGSLNLSSPTKYKDVFVAPFMMAGASDLGGTGGSLMSYDGLGGACWPAIRFGHTGSTCPVFAVVGAPLDAASAGSGTIWVDWASGSADATNDNVAVWAASVYALRSGSTTSEWTLTGSGIKAASIGDTSSCVMGSASIGQFNAPTGSPLGIRLAHDSTSASDGSGSNTLLLGVRLRYLVDKLGG